MAFILLQIITVYWQIRKVIAHTQHAARAAVEQAADSAKVLTKNQGDIPLLNIDPLQNLSPGLRVGRGLRGKFVADVLFMRSPPSFVGLDGETC